MDEIKEIPISLVMNDGVIPSPDGVTYKFRHGTNKDILLWEVEGYNNEAFYVFSDYPASDVLDEIKEKYADKDWFDPSDMDEVTGDGYDVNPVRIAYEKGYRLPYQNVPLRQFTPYDDPYHLSCDKNREEAIYRQEHEWNLGLAQGCEIDLPTVGPITLIVDYFPDITMYTTSEKNITKEIHEKGIKSYDLYTFVIKVVDLEGGGSEYEVYNIFWDGDVPSYDDTQENIDKMLYDVSGEKGFEEFVNLMNRNKFLPDDMAFKFNHELVDLSRDYRVIGVYRTHFSLRDGGGLVVDCNDVAQALNKYNN